MAVVHGGCEVMVERERVPGETAYYSDIDMVAQSDGYTHRDGTPYPKTGRRGP